MVFLTPPGEHDGLKREYKRLEDELAKKSNSKALIDLGVWLRWDSESANERTVVSLLRNILHLESQAKTPPLSDYLRHTLKAFICHIIDECDSAPASRQHSSEESNIIDSADVEIQGTKYRVERDASGPIWIQNLDTDERQPHTMPILRTIIKERKLSVDFKTKNGTQKNTRALGKEVIAALK